MERITLPAYAKINLTLDVEGRRNDGYHLLSTVFQTVSLCDLIEVKPCDGIRVSSDNQKLPEGPDNLAYRAAELILGEANKAENVYYKTSSPGGIDIKISKRIPLAAGLAGGSSDAAATLSGMNNLYELGLTTARLMELAVRLGADVPYCLLGGTVLGTGIGERLSLLPSLPGLWLVLCRPPLEVSTGEVYRHYRPRGEQKFTPGFVAALEQGDLEAVIQGMGNALEAVTSGLYPEVERVREVLLAAGALKVVMSGSGPAFFAICRGRDHARQVAGVVQPEYQETYVVRTV